MQLSWSGLEVRALREALRETRVGFCEVTGVHFDTLRKWERRGSTLVLRPVNAAILDTTLARATQDQRARFESRCAELRLQNNVPGVAAGQPKLGRDDTSAPFARRRLAEADDMNRRSLLGVLGVASAVLAAPVDWERLAAGAGSETVDTATVGQYALINQRLWWDYNAAAVKADVFQVVRRHLDALLRGVRLARTEAVRGQLYRMSSEVLQLLGEILFDSDDYAAAASCYTIAASFGKEAAAHDLWACALTRHAYLDIYTQQHDAAIPLLEAAGELAKKGDPQLATRYWVASVHGHALAALGDSYRWERTAEFVQGVQQLNSPSSAGWLRFDGGRLDEERGHCLVLLGQVDRAENTVLPVLEQPLSARRRAGVIVDAAAIAALHRDPVQLVQYGTIALDAAQRSRSGYLYRRLYDLRERMDPFREDAHVRHLDNAIASLASPTTTRRDLAARRH